MIYAIFDSFAFLIHKTSILALTLNINLDNSDNFKKNEKNEEKI